VSCMLMYQIAGRNLNKGNNEDWCNTTVILCENNCQTIVHLLLMNRAS